MNPKRVATAVACISLMACSYWFIVHSHRYGGLSTKVMGYITVILIILLDVLWVEPLFRSKVMKYVSVAVSIGLGFLVFDKIDSFRKQRLATQLVQNGVDGYGRVTDFELEHRKQKYGGDITYAVFKYSYQNRLYTQRVPAQPSTHLQEILRLRFANIDPENVVVTAFDVTTTP